MKKYKKNIVAVSGGFDPIHIGHIRMFREAKKMGDKLVVILNNDNWLMKKKGFVFMPQLERKEILESIEGIDDVVLTNHAKNTRDKSVCNELQKIRPDIFVNGGDRTRDNIPEVATCRKIGCSMVFNIGKGGKIQSSSWLTKSFFEEKKKNKNSEHISSGIYRQIIDSLPICTVDVLFLNKKKDKVLLFRRTNKPLKGHFFSVGGRMRKGESFVKAATRKVKEETGIKLLPQRLVFGGIQNEIHTTSPFSSIGYHCVNIYFGYILDKKNEISLDAQHDKVKWFDVSDEKLHTYIKGKLESVLKKI
jgi:D-beta-D-heptose 7-phosphate kinase/D-beta-D-heptose 1-phosphate adenosyltransferase